MTTTQFLEQVAPAKAGVAEDKGAARLGWAILGIGLVLALLLAGPGQTATTKYVNDLFIFLDGAHRVLAGQVPNVDFHSSLGPLAFYLPAVGAVLSRSMAGAMPVASALVVIFLAVIALHVIATRMRPVLGVPLALFVLLIAAVPANPGEGISEISFAMFYNRFGWAGLGLLLVMYLPPRVSRRGQTFLDAASAAALVLFMAYLKASYGLVGGAFLVLVLTDRVQWRWAALALLLCLAAAGLVQLVWGGTATYIADLRMAAQVSGDLPDLRKLAGTVLVNLADVVVYSLFALLLLLCRRKLRDLLFAGFCLATGVLIIGQNFQIVGILTLGAAAAVMAEAVSRTGNRWPRLAGLLRAGMPLLLLTLVGPPIVASSATVALHAFLTIERAGQPVPLPEYNGIRLVRLWSEGAYSNFVHYNQTLADGAAALQALGRPAGHLLVLDFVGPFSAGMNLEEPRGDSPWFHWDRTIDDRNFPPPEDLFADVRIVMEPKAPIEYWTSTGMRRLYGGYIQDHYTLAKDTAFWRIYVGKDDGDPAPPSASSAQTSTPKQSSSAQL